MKKLFFLLACVVMSVLSYGQNNQLVWANGRLLYGTPIVGMDSLTYDDMEDVDTLHLLLPRTLIKVVHDTVYIHDTVYVETDCGGEDDTPSAGIGTFSVSADKQVTFSKGNLQYHPANDEWRFAENQWDCVGDVENNNIATSYNGWIDLFGWGTGDNPLNLSQSTNDYHNYVDWGINKIGNDTPNTWRTLSKDEWLYILYERTNAESLFALGNIEGKEGIIILPDYWESPSGVNFIASNTQGLIWTDLHYENIGDYTDNTYTINEWMKLESAGAIFLPAAGIREHGNANFAGHNGVYWSSSSDDNEMAYYVHFNWDWLYPQALYYNHNGLSVRLVKDIEGGGTTPDTPDTPDTPTEPEEPENTENGHEYVDLGLSVKWATCNVGASKPEEYGDYFAWGETQPQDYYDWSTYKWCNGSSHTQTKYCTVSDYGTVDKKTVLEASDDAATANWGGAWRMPTEDEQYELRTECTWTWTTENGVKGYKVTSKSNGNSIFLPAAGWRDDSSLSRAGSNGFYWSSSLVTDNPNVAYVLCFGSDGVTWCNYVRYYGQSVRPVCQ